MDKLRMNNKGRRSAQIAGTVVSVIVIILLIMGGPAASAIMVDLNELDKNQIKKGEIVNTQASIEITNTETVQISNISLLIKQGEAFERTCIFNSSGKSIEGCDGIDIEMTSSAPYGYGYGYGYHDGEIIFDISIDSSILKTGHFDISLTALTSQGAKVSPTIGLVVQAENNGGGNNDKIYLERSKNKDITRPVLVNKYIVNDGQLKLPVDKVEEPKDLNFDFVRNQDADPDKADEEVNVKTSTTEYNRRTGGGITGAVVGVARTVGWLGWLTLMVFILTVLVVLVTVRHIKESHYRRKMLDNALRPYKIKSNLGSSWYDNAKPNGKGKFY